MPSGNPSFTRKAAELQRSLGDIRKRVACIASLALQEGCSRRMYHQFQILFGELGSMPDLPCIEGEDGLLRIPTEEVLQ